MLTSCSGMLYHPSKQVYYPPAQFGVAAKDITIKSKSGAELHSWYFTNSDNKAPKAIFVFYHGNGENLSSHYVSLLWILKHQYDFLIFDYAGYGSSTGKPSPEETVLDGEAALRFVHKTNPGIPIVIFAQSLGTAVALRNSIDLQAEIPIKYIIIDSGFLSYEHVAQKVLASHILSWPFQWLPYLVLSDKFAPGDDIKKMKIPLLVVHGDEDAVVDYSLGEEVFAKANEPKEFWPISHGRHINAFAGKDPATHQKLLDRLGKLFP